MRRDICHFFQMPFQNVYQAYLDAAWQRFGKDCRQTTYTIQFGLNMSLKYNMNGGSCTVHFMPYQNGTAVCLRYTIVQVAGARYKAFDGELSQYVCANLGAPLMDIDIPMETFLQFASANGDAGFGYDNGQEEDVQQDFSQQPKQEEAYAGQYEQPQEYAGQYTQPQQYAEQYAQPQQNAYAPNSVMEHKKIGLIVWGAIMAVIGLIFLSTGRGVAGFIVLGLMFLAGGGVMLAFGIRNAVLVTRKNTALLNDGKLYAAYCPYCRSEIRAQTRNFAVHRNFPEGFMYCPVCRKPISRNAFVIQNTQR